MVGPAAPVKAQALATRARADDRQPVRRDAERDELGIAIGIGLDRDGGEAPAPGGRDGELGQGLVLGRVLELGQRQRRA